MLNRQGNHYNPVHLLIIFLSIMSIILAGCTTQPQNYPAVTPDAPQTEVTSTIEVFDTPAPKPSRTSTTTILPTSVCKEKTGLVSRQVFQSTTLPGRMYFSLYLPPCFNRSQNLPALFLLHGLTSKDDQWIKLGLVDLVDKLIANGEIPPLVLVFPYDPNPNVPPKSNFGDAFASDLVAYISEQYGTGTNAIGGISRGGGWAFYIASHYPQLFRAVGGHSPVLFTWDPERMSAALKDLPNQTPIWLDTGEKDNEVNYLLTLESALKTSGKDVKLSIFPGDHSESYWQTHLQDYILWYARTLSEK